MHVRTIYCQNIALLLIQISSGSSPSYSSIPTICISPRTASTLVLCRRSICFSLLNFQDLQHFQKKRRITTPTMVAITIKWNGFSRNESRSSISLDKDDVGIEFIVSVGDGNVVCTETGEKSPVLGDKAGAKPEDGALAVEVETGARAE